MYFYLPTLRVRNVICRRDMEKAIKEISVNTILRKQ